jgi:hypothetical protein
MTLTENLPRNLGETWGAWKVGDVVTEDFREFESDPPDIHQMKITGFFMDVYSSFATLESMKNGYETVCRCDMLHESL